jgi:hypothetical protein
MVTQGCKQENQNPENSDPIYLDLLKETRAFESSVADLEKKVEDATKELSKTEPRTLDRKNAQRELDKQVGLLSKSKEMLEFFKIRTERRRVEGRRAYKIAFKENRNWPDKKEIEAYQINKKLLYSSKNWNDRVPKTKHNQIQNKPGVTEADGKGSAENITGGH